MGAADRRPDRAGGSSLALDGCRLERVLGGRVEIAEATAMNRTFPDRVTDTLGVCLKIGGQNDVRADGKSLRYPRDALCVRPPGCVWSVRATGEIAFLSIDVDIGLVPGDLTGTMRFAPAAALSPLRRWVAVLRSDAPALHKESVVAAMIDALVGAGGLESREVRAAASPSTRPGALERARELLSSELRDPPSLQELADAVGGNRFGLVRDFHRRFGLPPHAFLLRLRVERARAMLARGDELADVAHAVGFADQSHLSRSFKRVVGLTPAAYRRHVHVRAG